MADDLILTANGRAISGWEEISVRLSAETMPNSFEIALSALDPATGLDLVVRPGDSCGIALGGDTVVTGYIDSVTNSGSAGGHAIRVAGRGKCQDLVDCSAEWDGGQIRDGTALDIATKLASPYKIAVALVNGAQAGPQVPQFALTYGETAADIIQRVARNAGLLAYETTDGSLALAAVGSKVAASGAIYAVAPTPNSIEIEISGIPGAGATTKAAIAAAVTGALRASGVPGGITNISTIEAAIAAVAGTAGFVLTGITCSAGTVAPGAAGNITSNAGALPVLGTVSYV
ncbi:phage baseplate assembly protein [Sphingomonas abietis]|uniref:Contractile injection system protein, VgrG/Pvc8 family n=1 Tax=Sphingomonas abietis TaxID=3012344 RepID=A0ABY7NJJ2_9SPHN|nr:contractile injection system protein, VgrG/Pvc8 family [Sphingomonas abietis]WBO20985.1 contractile injection system protein, VgrG/Pvc8 family [Sphingomonas abietis]